MKSTKICHKVICSDQWGNLCLRTALVSYKSAKLFTRLCQSSYSGLLEAMICRDFKYLSAELNLGSSENLGRIASVPTLIKFTSQFHILEICLFGTGTHPSLTAQSQGAQGPTNVFGCTQLVRAPTLLHLY